VRDGRPDQRLNRPDIAVIGVVGWDVASDDDKRARFE
jgi:hypothetical protein